MRFYGFGNYYLSSLQQGLQAGHAAVDLYVKYHLEQELSNQQVLFADWAANHKTMVLLNGGNSADLQDLFNFLSCEENPYPFVKFHEDEVSLNGALTYVGMILPPKIYETSARMRSSREFEHDPVSAQLYFCDAFRAKNEMSVDDVITDISVWEFELMKRLNQYGLAK